MDIKHNSYVPKASEGLIEDTVENVHKEFETLLPLHSKLEWPSPKIYGQHPQDNSHMIFNTRLCCSVVLCVQCLSLCFILLAMVLFVLFQINCLVYVYHCNLNGLPQKSKT